MYNSTAKESQVNTKSPISMLQELMIKEMQRLPIYTLIHDGMGTHLCSFTIRVECKGLCVEASASSKKEAKHKAAQGMLNLLINELVIDEPKSVVPNDLMKSGNIAATHEVTQINSTSNSIGKLQELCVQNRLGEPQYEIIDTSGPSHAPIFTFTCTVETVQEQASARSKKQAKQDVAQKLLNRLRNETNVPEALKCKIARVNEEEVETLVKGIEVMDLSLTISKQSIIEQSNVAMARYANLTKQSGIVNCIDTKIPIFMYHKYLKDRKLNFIELLSSLAIAKQSDRVSYDELQTALIISTARLACKIKKISYKLKTTNFHMIGIQLTLNPRIMGIGYGTTQREADKNAIVDVMETLMIANQLSQEIDTSTRTTAGCSTYNNQSFDY